MANSPSLPPIADRATPKGLARLVEVARAFHADPNDDGKRLAFMRVTFNHDRAAAMIVALADEGASPAAAEGEWVLVPREPTREMLDRAQMDAAHHDTARRGYGFRDAWLSMLSAAPASPAERPARPRETPSNPEVERLREALMGAASRLTAALDCPTWSWDADRHDIATMARDIARAAPSTAPGLKGEGGEEDISSRAESGGTAQEPKSDSPSPTEIARILGKPGQTFIGSAKSDAEGH